MGRGIYFFLYHGLHSILLRNDGEKAWQQSGLRHSRANSYIDGMPVLLGPDRHQATAAKKPTSYLLHSDKQK